MKSIIVIPSRYGSSRFPGKPLAEIAGHSLIKRVWSVARAVENIDDVIIATDDDRIYNHALDFGARTVMTSEGCRNGTERVYEASKGLRVNSDIIINLQGDAVLTPPWIIQAVVDNLIQDENVQIATPAVNLTWQQFTRLEKAKKAGQTTGTLVTFDADQNALYFSKNMIPNIRLRDEGKNHSPAYQHIGLYGFRRESLFHYINLSPSPLEQAEQLEQLRALENGMPIKIVPVDYKGRSSWSIDCPEDISVVEEIISAEGELVEQL